MKGHRKEFYEQYYPWFVVFSRLTNNEAHQLEYLEIGFRVGSDDRSFMTMDRSRTFTTYDDLYKWAVRYKPLSLEVGAIVPPKPVDILVDHLGWRKLIQEYPVGFQQFKPLVFDWDINHEQRQLWGGCACDTYALCDLCWKAFAEPAHKLLHRVLTHWLGYEKVFMVFSGRRGFHVWVTDDAVFDLDRNQRDCIVQRIQAPIKGSPMWREMEEFLRGYWCEYHGSTHAYGPMKLLYVLDTPVTVDVNHLVGVPLMPNAYNGMIRHPLSYSGGVTHVSQVRKKMIEEMVNEIKE